MFNFKIETIVGLFMALVFITFFYMTSQVGFFRLDRSKYIIYKVCFSDAFGIEKKADVKMCGIKVGWIDSIAFQPTIEQVWANIMVQKECCLHANASALIKQDGLLGSKYLELIPGNSALPRLDPHGGCIKGLSGDTSLDALIEEVKVTSGQVSHVAASVQNFCTDENALLLKDVLQQLNDTSRSLASVAQSVQGIVARNEQLLQSTLQDMHVLVNQLTKNAPDVAQKCMAASEHIENVARKINEGQGIIGQLVNDAHLGCDLKQAVHSVKNTLTALHDMAFVSDTHFEAMLGPIEHTNFNDVKAYLDFRLYPTPNYFYLGGLVGRHSGIIERELHLHHKEKNRKWHNDLPLRGAPFDYLKREPVRVLDKWLWNLQFGKLYKNCALRGGFFESTLGIGLDVAIPLPSDKIGWLTTFEAYDFNGRLRIDDHRPHLKWWNRFFLNKNFYFAFGLDDFISRHNSNFFLGAGLWVDDDDIGAFFTKWRGKS